MLEAELATNTADLKLELGVRGLDSIFPEIYVFEFIEPFGVGLSGIDQFFPLENANSHWFRKNRILWSPLDENFALGHDPGKFKIVTFAVEQVLDGIGREPVQGERIIIWLEVEIRVIGPDYELLVFLLIDWH